MTRKYSRAFISYSHKDKAFVSRLVSDLGSIGAKVWLDLVEMKVGDSMVQKIQDGINDSEWLVIVLSPNSIESSWVNKELSAALVKELEKKSVYILPLLYKECEIPIMLRDKLYADFTQSYEEGLQSLADRIAPELDTEILKDLLSDDYTAIRMAWNNVPLESRNTYIQMVKGKLLSDLEAERNAAMTALYVMNKSVLRHHLIGLAEDPSTYVARTAIFYIGNLAMKEGIGIVSAKMSDGTPHIRAAAREAYNKLLRR